MYIYFMETNMTKKTKQEKAYDQFYYDLCDVTDKAENLSVPYIVYLGIGFFTQMAVDFAPNEKEGKKMVRDLVTIIKRQTA